jgi:hypothetical protein
MTLWGKVAKSAPEPDFIKVKSRNCGSIQVHAHKHKITAKPHGNKKKAKTINSKKKTGQPKQSALAKVPDDYKESAQLTNTALHIQEIRDHLVNSFKKEV